MQLKHPDHTSKSQEIQEHRQEKGRKELIKQMHSSSSNVTPALIDHKKNVTPAPKHSITTNQCRVVRRSYKKLAPLPVETITWYLFIIRAYTDTYHITAELCYPRQ